VLLNKKNAIFGISKSLSARNRLFLALFLYISGGVGAYLPPLTHSTTTPTWALPLLPPTTAAA
jgi:hypothetical protein